MRLASRCCPTRMGNALEDEVEKGAHEDTPNADDQQARGEHAQSRELCDTGGECTQSRIISRCRQERVPREQVTHADKRMGIAHMDVLVDKGEGVGRAHYLHQVQSEPEKDDEGQPLQRIDIACQSTRRDGNEDQQHAEPKQQICWDGGIFTSTGFVGHRENAEPGRAAKHDRDYPAICKSSRLRLLRGRRHRKSFWLQQISPSGRRRLLRPVVGRYRALRTGPARRGHWWTKGIRVGPSPDLLVVTAVSHPSARSLSTPIEDDVYASAQLHCQECPTHCADAR